MSNHFPPSLNIWKRLLLLVCGLWSMKLDCASHQNKQITEPLYKHSSHLTSPVRKKQPETVTAAWFYVSLCKWFHDIFACASASSLWRHFSFFAGVFLQDSCSVNSFNSYRHYDMMLTVTLDKDLVTRTPEVKGHSGEMNKVNKGFYFVSDGC